VGQPYQALRRRLRHPERSEAELDEELQSYFDVMVERQMSRRLTREQAERAVRLEFDGGNDRFALRHLFNQLHSVSSWGQWRPQ